MNMKDYIVIVLLIIVLLVLFKVLQNTKNSKQENYIDKAVQKSDKETKKFVEDQLSGKKLKIKVKYNRVVKILKELDKPMTIDSILEVYNDRHKEVNKGVINGFTKWLVKNQVINSEEIDGVGLVYGLEFWFEDNELIEEYFEKLKA